MDPSVQQSEIVIVSIAALVMLWFAHLRYRWFWVSFFAFPALVVASSLAMESLDAPASVQIAQDSPRMINARYGDHGPPDVQPVYYRERSR